MKIKEVKSYVLQYRLEEELGYSQQYYDRRTVHLIEVVTDEGLRGYGEAFGGGNVALANRTIAEQVIGPLIAGMDPLDREVIWHRVYNLLRDHGQKGMPLQALSGVDIALWDLAGKIQGQPLYKLLGGAFRDRIPAYGYGMMLQRVPDLAGRFAEESRKIAAGGFKALKMKIGLGPRQDAKLVDAVRKAVGPEIQLMVDANHCYTAREAIPLGRELERLDVFWFEEPVAPEDHQGYRDLCLALDMNIAGGEAEFARWGFRQLIEGRCVDVLQPETCGLGGISEYLKVLALSRIILDNVPNIQASWVTQGAKMAQVALFFGANDLGGTMLEENVVAAAGCSFRMSMTEMITLIRGAGFRAAQRTTLYRTVQEF